MKIQINFDGLKHCKPLAGVGFFVIFSLMLGCASTTEPIRRMPNINLSPAVMNFEVDADTANSRDFGLSLATNESDSLDNLEVLPGLKVKSVRQGSPAALAGVKTGDIVLAFDGSETNQVDTFLSIAEATSKDGIVLKGLRDTTVYETTVQTPEPLIKAIPKELYRLDPVKTLAAYETQVLTNQNNQSTVTVAKVVELLPDSPLSKVGIKNNDLISAVNGNAVESAQGLINQVHNNYEFGEKVEFTVVRSEFDGGGFEEISVKLWDPGTRINQLSFWPLFKYSSSLDPDNTRFKLVPILGYSLFSYEKNGLEKNYSLITFIKFHSGLQGELIDVTETGGNNDE